VLSACNARRRWSDVGATSVNISCTAIAISSSFVTIGV
jgi:hypothetical protein